MVLVQTPTVNKQFIAPDFNLLGIDGNYYNLANSRAKNGLVVVFMCNHCPYVQAIIDQIVHDARALRTYDVNFIGINSNDTDKYPDDSYEMMQNFAKVHDINFPYVIDPTQEVARQYNAVCTPDFFGFNDKLELKYRGRLNASRLEKIPEAKHELLEAMIQIAQDHEYHSEQRPSIGCSIKWKE